MSSLVSALKYNFGGQLIARLMSFGINMYLLRVVDNDVLGLVNVRMMLLYNTILFLTREPMRKAHILRDSMPQFINLLWLSPLVSTVLSVLCVVLWTLFSSSGREVPLFVLLSFPISAVIEAIAEPFAVICLRFSLGQHFAIGQSLLIFLQRFFVFVCLFAFPHVYHLDLFAYAQIFASSTYLLFHVLAFRSYFGGRTSKPELVAFKSFGDLLPKPSAGLNPEAMNALGVMFSHSVLKQLLTDGSAYVMTFTEMMSLKSQAVFDAVEKVGSLVARIVLAPVEENCYAYFANIIRHRSEEPGSSSNSKAHDELAQTLTTILHVVGVVGSVACVFGIPYSPTVIWVYGGRLLFENGGARLLSIYSVYLWVMAINGITECFAVASMDNSGVFSHGSFLFGAAVMHVVLSASLCAFIGSAGFIVANIVNMLFRVVYSWRQIVAYLGEKAPSMTCIFPSLSIAGSLFFCFFATSFSYLLFGTTPGFSHAAVHVAIGGVLFGLLALNIQHDPVFSGLVASTARRPPSTGISRAWNSF